eukprot:g29327.t1
MNEEKAAIYIHAMASATALAIGPFQVIPSWRRKHMLGHRRAGRVYFVCCFAGSISGMTLSLSAQGGMVGKVGFFSLGVVWLLSNLVGFVAIVFPKIRTIWLHEAAMQVSCALTYSAVSLRIMLPVAVLNTEHFQPLCFALDIACQVLYNGVMHYSAKHALLAAQYPDATDHLQAPGSAEVSAALKLIRLKAMEKILRDKFQRSLASQEYRKKLKDTGDRDLVWENEEDTFWGATKGRGQNHLGRILMDVRKSIHDARRDLRAFLPLFSRLHQEETDFHSWLFLCCELESDSVRWPPVELVESKDDGSGDTQVHRLTGKDWMHALILHSKLEVARPTGGVAIMDLGSKRLTNGFVLEPLKSSCKLKLGASTRSYEVRVNLRSQIEELERQQRELMREAAKRLAKEEATCFVGGLEYDTEKADLLGLFQDCGHVEEVRFPGQQEVGGKAVKGIAFVVFDSAMAARRACGLSGEMFKGRKLKVAPATDRPKGGVVLQAWDGGWIRSLAWTAAVL